MTTEAGALFSRNLQRDDKALQPGITVVNLSYVSTNLDDAAHHAAKHLADTGEGRRGLRARSPIYTLSPPSCYMSNRGGAGLDVHAFYQGADLQTRRVQLGRTLRGFPALAEGTGKAPFRLRFSFIL